MRKFSCRCLILILFVIACFVYWRPAILSYFTFVPTKLEQKVSLDDVVAEELFLKTSDGVTLHALYFSADVSDSMVVNAAKPQDDIKPTMSKAVLYLHGNAGNLYDRVHTVNELRDLGVNVLLIDYRGFGLSEGTITEKGMYLDVDTGFQYLINNKGFSEQNIAVLGRSIGSVAALYLAEKYQPGAVFLVSPLASATHMASEMGFDYLKWFAYGSLNNIDRASRVKSPVLIIHGDEDAMIPISQGYEVFDALTIKPENKQFIVVKGANHHNVRDMAGLQYWHWMLGFMEKVQ